MFFIQVKLLIFLLSFLNIPGGTPQNGLYAKFQQSDYKVKFERIELTSFNKQMMKKFEIVTFKYNRTCAACNFTLEFKVTTGNELEVIIQGYRFASNEYRLFPLRLQVNACLAIKNDIVGVGKLLKYGNFTCPIPKDKLLTIYNWTPDESKFPPFVPSGRYMVEIQLIHRNTQCAAMNAYAEFYRPIPISD